MLQMTSKAANILNQARAQNGLPEHFGVRISGNPVAEPEPQSPSPYRFGFVEGPKEGDVVGETDGTNYYVAPEVAEVLEEAVLDVDETERLILTRPA